jgi:Haem-binding domain
MGGGRIVAISAFVHPFGMVKAQDYEMPLFAGAQIDLDVLQIFERSCHTCHLESTEWPWYSYIAPIGWFIERDLQQGREHMDFSRWDEYDRGSQRDILTRCQPSYGAGRCPCPDISSSTPAPNSPKERFRWSMSGRKKTACD